MVEDWGQIKIDENKVWKDSVNELRQQIILMNQNQLKAGFDAKGMKLPPYSSPYALKKRKPVQPKTLYDTGAFHKGFYALAFDNFIEIGSKDWKEAILESAYPDLHGLTDENIKEFQNLLIPIYRRNLINAILQT